MLFLKELGQYMSRYLVHHSILGILVFKYDGASLILTLEVCR